MNIFEWLDDVIEELIESGNTRLAQLIFEIPSAACDDDHAAVDAMVPEALGLARALDNPWLELFIRHWHLQSRVLHRHEVAGCLAEAVSLYEFAHRAETERCPQSVCTVQDLAATYGDLDGPGYAEERMAVSRETLATIGPDWPCFDCISGELAEALLDAGRPAEMLEFVDGQRRAQLAAGRLDNSGNLPRARAEALIALGRHDEAIAQLSDNVTDGGGDHAELYRRLLLARALFCVGRVDEAREIGPPVSAVFDTPGHYRGWLDAHLAEVAVDGSANTWRSGRVIALMQERLEQNGARYLAAEVACDGAELAAGRGARIVAARLIARARRQLPELREPQPLAERLAAVEAAIAAETGDPFAGLAGLELSGPGDVRRALGDDPEVALQRIEAAAVRWPDEPAWAPERAFALMACGLEPESDAIFREHIAAHPDDTAAIGALADSMLERGRTRELREFLEGAGAASESFEVRWIIARSLRDEGDIDGCAAVLEPIADQPPAALMLAELRRRQGDPGAGLALLDPLVAAGVEPGPWDWERMVCASLTERWDEVRDSAARVGMELPGSGPIDLPGPLCQILVPAEDGSEQSMFAVRTGPVTARIIQIAGPGPEPERYRDLWVFEADELDPPEDLDDPEHVSVYRGVAELESAGYTGYAIDGPHPGDAAIDALRAALESHDVELQVRSVPDYVVVDAERDGAELPGVYAVIAAPPEREPGELAQLLADLTSAWKLPIAWLELAAATGNPELIARHDALAERFSL